MNETLKGILESVFLILCTFAIIFGVVFVIKAYQQRHYEYCAKYRVVKSYQVVGDKYGNLGNFYVEFQDGTSTSFKSRKGNEPIVGQSLCVEFLTV
jgi:hypothetical protein